MFWTVALDNTLESLLDSKEIKPVNTKVNQSSIFVGRIDAEAEVLILWPPDTKNWLIRKTLMLEKIEGWRRREWQRMGWCQMASPTRWTWAWESSGSGWWTGKPACCSPWGRKESDRTERLNWTELSSRQKWRVCSTWFETLEDRTVKETGRLAGSNSR